MCGQQKVFFLNPRWCQADSVRVDTDSVSKGGKVVACCYYCRRKAVFSGSSKFSQGHRGAGRQIYEVSSWTVVGQASTLEERSRGAKFSLRGKSSSSVRTLRKLLLLLCLPRGGTGTAAATHSSLAAGAEYAKAGHQLGEDCWEGAS